MAQKTERTCIHAFTQHLMLPEGETKQSAHEDLLSVMAVNIHASGHIALQ